MNWRSSDWENPYPEHRVCADEEGVLETCIGFEHAIYEAGADAMLEELAELVGEDGWISFEKEDGKVTAVYIAE